MKPKYKVTGCARFFIFFIILIPAVWFGAAYFRGEDGVEQFKELIHKVTGGASSDRKDNQTKSIDQLEKELREAKERVKELEEDLEEAKKK